MHGRGGDQFGQVATQLLPFRRGLRPAHQQLQRQLLGLGPLAVAQQLPEGLPARHATLARDQAEHQAQLVGRIPLGGGQHRELPLQNHLGLRRPAQPGERRGIGTQEGVAQALALVAIHVAAQARQLGFAHRSGA